MCHWCSYHILTSSAIYYWTEARQNGIYLFYIITKQITTHKAFVYFKILQHNAQAGLCPTFAHFGEDAKKPFDLIYDLYKMRQFHWWLCVVKLSQCASLKLTDLISLIRIFYNVQDHKLVWDTVDTFSHSLFLNYALLKREGLVIVKVVWSTWKPTLFLHNIHIKSSFAGER